MSLPDAISYVCPIRPKPVTSVQACTSYLTIASRAALFSVVIREYIRSCPAFESMSALFAVESTPMPIGFVSSSTSPGLASELVSILSGCTKPVTARPYLGSSSCMLWPPVISAPASYTLSYPPFSSACTASMGIFSGMAIMFRQSLGSPPIAYMSERALVAAIWPKRYGSSAIGGKKSTVCTIASSSLIL